MAGNVKAFFEELRSNDPELQSEYERQAPRFRALSALIALRQELNVSQAELARRMGVSQPVVAKLESGEGNVKIDTLARAAAALGRELEVTFSVPQERQNVGQTPRAG